jgi:hypothetical protein
MDNRSAFYRGNMAQFIQSSRADILEARGRGEQEERMVSVLETTSLRKVYSLLIRNTFLEKSI